MKFKPTRLGIIILFLFFLSILFLAFGWKGAAQITFLVLFFIVLSFRDPVLYCNQTKIKQEFKVEIEQKPSEFILLQNSLRDALVADPNSRQVQADLIMSNFALQLTTFAPQWNKKDYDVMDAYQYYYKTFLKDD